MIYALQSNIWFLVFASLWIKKPAMFLLPCIGSTFLVCSPDAINCPCVASPFVELISLLKFLSMTLMLAVNSSDPCFVSQQALQAAVEKQMELVETVEALQHRPSIVRVSHS